MDSLSSSPGTPPEPTRAVRICGPFGDVCGFPRVCNADSCFRADHDTYPPAPLAPSSAPGDVPAQEQDEGKTSKSATASPSQLESRASRDAPVPDGNKPDADEEWITIRTFHHRAEPEGLAP